MILSYDALREKYVNLAMGIVFDSLLLLTNFASMCFWFIEWHPYLIIFKIWNGVLSIIGLVSPAFHLGYENWYPEEFDKHSDSISPSAGDFGK